MTYDSRVIRGRMHSRRAAVCYQALRDRGRHGEKLRVNRDTVVSGLSALLKEHGDVGVLHVRL